MSKKKTYWEKVDVEVSFDGYLQPNDNGESAPSLSTTFDDFEYIEETLDHATREGMVIATIDKEDYERSATIEAIMQLKKVAEA